MNQESEKKLIWLDLEMTGLDQEKNRIIEIAVVITDLGLETVAEGPVIAIHQPEGVLSIMDSWNTQQHTASGLVEGVRQSAVTEAEAEQSILRFIQEHVAPQASPLCGNSIGTDRRFLAKYMPTLERYFHYRNLDVSTVKILAEAWHPAMAAQVKKSSEHRALADIYDSIAELRYYKGVFFTL